MAEKNAVVHLGGCLAVVLATDLGKT